jgi:uncharacterized protein (DUF2141 family)
MNFSLNKFLILLIVIISFANCAKRGTPSGGEKDLTAPILISASPNQESTHFDSKRIKIYFDEYIKLKDVNKQLIVSPPLKNSLDITPVGTASKILTIKLKDTLRENTTYTINFGNSVIDNNEGNQLKSFKYVFSTGSYIDSLKLDGDVYDAFNQKTDDDISVLLYEIDSTFNDSIIYKEKPMYVTSTLDSTNFQFTNLKKGNYLVLALKQSNKNYIYNPKQDKIGFLNNPITLPTDTVLNIPIFNEKLPFKFFKAIETSKGHIIFSYEGNGKDLKVKLLDKIPDSITTETVFEKNKDTLNFWFKPFKQDSLQFEVSHKNFIDTVTVKLKSTKQDTLILNNAINSNLNPRDTFGIHSNIPIYKFDISKISIINKDSVAVPFTAKTDEYKMNLSVYFKSEFENQYKVEILPEAIIDVFGNTNDTLVYIEKTKKIDEYGTINLQVSNVNSPTIIQLLTDKDVLVAEEIIKTNQVVSFKLLQPKKYYIRAIYDTNNNGIWDTGNYLLKIQPEKVYYLKTPLELRANWDLNEIFTLK